MASLAALGGVAYGVQGLYDYNRENHAFDQMQWIRREELRLKMQIKQFQLFRHDIRDLVRLTVDRMDVYHLLGGLFLSFCIIILTKGRLVQVKTPPFVLSLFMLSSACTFIYLVLAVWLSMHASIAAHSFGVRVLTRFVRLPIPTYSKIKSLTFKLKDFERQGIANLLRVPFFTQQNEAQVAALGEAATALGDSSQTVVSKHFVVAEGKGRAVSESLLSEKHIIEEEVDLGQEEWIKNGDKLLEGTSGVLPERHVQLFRQLQSKWQCYDAYCRVCMGLGVNQLLQVLSYYSTCNTLMENHSASVGVALNFMFQCVTVALAVLDLAGLKAHEILVIQLIGTLPCLLTTFMLAVANRDNAGSFDPNASFPWSPLTFLFTIVWIELWIRVAAPSPEMAGLPRRFRQMLFLDVFGDSAEWNPQMEMMIGDNEHDTFVEGRKELAVQVLSQIRLGRCAVRRWTSVPKWAFSRDQRKALTELEGRLASWERTASAEFTQDNSGVLQRNDLLGCLDRVDEAMLCWNELSEEEKAGDPFARCLCGPFAHSGVEASYYYDLESGRTVFEETPDWREQGCLVLTLEAVATVINELEAVVRRFLEVRVVLDLEIAKRHVNERVKRLRRETIKRKAGKLRKLRPSNSIPNLMGLASDLRLGSIPQVKFKHGRLKLRRGGRKVAGRSESGLSSAIICSSENRDDGRAHDEDHEQDDDDIEEPLSPRESVAGSARAFGRGGASSEDSDDATLVAMAGRDAQHFVPHGLPWQVLSRLSLLLQMCWFLAFVMSVVREVSYMYPEKGLGIVESPPARMLFAAANYMAFEHVAVEWPHSDFFRATSLSCMSGPGPGVIVSSRFAFYTLRSPVPKGGHYIAEETDRRPLPSTITSLCGSSAISISDCWLASPQGNSSLILWPPASGPHMANSTLTTPVILPLDNASWRMIAGAEMPCGRLRRLLPQGARVSDLSCLLLVGWDGTALTVALIPVMLRQPEALDEDVIIDPTSTSSEGTTLGTPLIALVGTQRSAGLAAMHVSPSGVLVALLPSGELEAVDLLSGRSLGGWRATWPSSSAGPSGMFVASSVCHRADADTGATEVFMLGRRGIVPILSRATAAADL